MKNIIIKHFNELNTIELYQLLSLRTEIFVAEQKSIYNDIDFKDYYAYHLMLLDNDKVIACTRIFFNFLNNPNLASIGRVVVDAQYRRQKYGIEIMEKSIEYIKQNKEMKHIQISAQSYLLKFYNSFGFNVIGEEYIEDGIPHHKMISDL